MKKSNRFIVVVMSTLLFIFLWSLPTQAGYQPPDRGTFTQADLAGTWYGHQVVSGDAPNDDPRWGYGTIVVNSTGNFTATWDSPTNTNEVSNGTIQITGDGTVGLNNEPLIHGVMNDDKDQIVLTDGSSGSKGNSLMIFVKRSLVTTFNTNDLAGTWYGHQVVSGDAPNDDPRWGYGTIVVNSTGNFTATWDSPTNTNEVSNGTIQITGDGTVGLNNEPLIHGVMNDDKDQIVLTDGSSGSKGNSLMIFVKRSLVTTFNTNDLAGTWYGHQVVSGDAPNDDPRWGYGTIVVNSTGNFTATWDSPTNTNEVSNGTIQITGDGTVGLNNEPLIHGVMNDDKDQIVLTDGSSGSKGNSLMIFVKRSITGDDAPDPACVSQKFKTSSTLCTALMNCWVKEIKDVKDKYVVKDYTEKAIQKFGTGWGKAQDKADSKGINCDAGSKEEIGGMINDALEDIYDYISGDTDKGNKNSITLGSDLLKAAGKRCSSLLNAQSAYIKDKSVSRDAKLTKAIAKADNAFIASFNKAKAKAAKKKLSCDDSIKTYLEGAINDLESGILSTMGL